MSRQSVWNWAATSTRLIVGAGAAVGLVVAVGVGVAAPWPSHEREALAIAVTPTPADTVLACAGPIVALGRDATQASQLSVAAESGVVSGSAGSSLESRDDATSPTVVGGTGSPVLTAAPDGDARSDAAAASSASVGADDLRGFSAAACQPSLIESWLVAGATTTGSADLITLSNPSDVVATVDLTLYGATGVSRPPAGAALRIDARSQRVVPLAALGVGEGAPIVRVTASGAPIAAALQSSTTRTLLAGGVDQSGAIVGADTTQVVPGVRVPQSAVDAASVGATTLLRILSPAQAATAEVTVHDDTGRQVLSQDLPLTADQPAELDLAGLGAGTYSVEITAPTAVVAAVWQTTGFGDGADFAWYASASPIDVSSVVAVADGPSPTVVLAASASSADVVLDPLEGDGARDRVTVPAGETVSVPVSAGTVYRLETDAPVRAAVSYLGDGAIAAYPVWPADAAAAELLVRP